MDKVANLIIIKNRFANLSKKELKEKEKDYYENRFFRYFQYHKGRSFIILIAVIILILCFAFNYPINGDIDNTNPITVVFSALGFFTANIFLALLLTVIGVETFMSRDELNELKTANEEHIDIEIENIKKNPTANKIRKVSNLLQKILLYKNKKSIYIDNNEKISNSDIDGQNDNINFTNIFNKSNNNIDLLNTFKTELLSISDEEKKFKFSNELLDN